MACGQGCGIYFCPERYRRELRSPPHLSPNLEPLPHWGYKLEKYFIEKHHFKLFFNILNNIYKKVFINNNFNNNIK